MWFRTLKVLGLIFFCFYPWWVLSIFLHPWYGPLVACILTIVSLVVLKLYPDILLLALLKAKEQRKSISTEIFSQLKDVSFSYRIPTPKLYFTYKGTRNVYALYRGKQATIIIHENCLNYLTKEEFHTVFSWLLSPVPRKMLRKGTFLSALTSLAILPFIFMIILIRKLSFLPESLTDGPKTCFELLTLGLIEISHSIFYDQSVVNKTDLNLKAKLDSSSDVISALGKLEQDKEPFSWAEKILMSNRFSQTQHHVRIFSLLANYNDPEQRIDVLKNLDIGR